MRACAESGGVCLGTAERRGNVHQARIIADHQRGAGEQLDRFIQRGLASQVPALDGGALLAFFRRAQHDRGELQALGELAEVRPALGRPILRAGTQHCVAPLDTEALARGQLRLRIHREPGLGQGLRDRRTGLFRQPRIVHRHRLAPGGFPVEEVEQSVARLADVAGADRDAGEKRHQRGLPGIGQHDGLVVTDRLERAPEAPALAQPEPAVLKRGFDHPGNLRHAPHHRRHPGGGQDIDARLRQFFAQPREHGLRHQRVADPVRGDD